MALPYVDRNYKAITLARLVEWANLNTKKRWVKMEDTLYGTQLQKIIWIPPKYRTHSKTTHKISKNSTSNMGYTLL